MNREWMYRRSTPKGAFSPEFLNGLESFIEFACSKPAFMDGVKIRCPCRKCQNRYFKDVETVRAHVKKKGFEFNYQVWVFQGESRLSDQFQHTVVGDRGASNQYREMVIDAGGPSNFENYDADHTMDNEGDRDEAPNPEAQRFYDMLKAADRRCLRGRRRIACLSPMVRGQARSDILVAPGVQLHTPGP